ncbi:hypothetical protein ABE65_007725 [Fictibacillus phosphorivorans]|uniref:Uncharacterized protein n=1 Tax=Fictibacillus phosphorivorans TaxID=1221500 RepID=A0A168VX86_9BACL|nr:hypothetical protein [Fictibacillus phosphorivorans]ANC76695.1 hypothetical protein ABE65_007725 [Fictibacillus phosphorivorans]
MAIIQSRTLRSRIIPLASENLVNVFITGNNATPFSNVSIREIGGNFFRVFNAATGINALINLFEVGSIDNAAGAGITPEVNSIDFRDRIIEFARVFTVDIYVPGLAAPFLSNVTIREVGSDYIRVTSTTLDQYIPFTSIAAIDQNLILLSTNTPTVTSRTIRSILITLANGDVVVDLIVAGRFFPSVQIDEVQSDYARINNAAQTKFPLLDIVSVDIF